MDTKNLLKSEKIFTLVTLFGAGFAIFSLVLGWGGAEFGINFAVKNMARLVPGTDTWETWKTVPLPVYIKFNLFNITNSQELANGAKPALTQMGPYVYLVDFDKFDFSINETLDTVRYSPSRTYYFQPDKSKGKEDDLVTYVNIMFVAVSHLANDFKDIEPILLETLDGILADKGEKLTRTDKVKGLLFTGVSIQAYVELVDDLSSVPDVGGIQLPKDFEDGLFALFKGKNGTKDVPWECYAGIRNSTELGKIHSYDGQRKLSLYPGDSCNTINGTDGTLNQPFIIPGETELDLFVPELCRSIRWEFVGMFDSGGIPVARYRFPKMTTPQEDPSMACFCPREDLKECEVEGIANLAKCFGGAPLLYSKPHFLQVQKSVRDQVDGLEAHDVLHESRLDVHPLTGAAVATNIKMQFSIQLVPWESMPSFQSASKAIIPFVWVELAAELSGPIHVVITALCLFLKLLPILRWFALLGSLAIFSLGLHFGYRCRKHNNKVRAIQNALAEQAKQILK